MAETAWSIQSAKCSTKPPGGSVILVFRRKVTGLRFSTTLRFQTLEVLSRWWISAAISIFCPELDTEKLRERVAAAETAIFNRLQAISQGSNHTAERQAIEDALASLHVLKRDNLGFPDWEKK